MERYFHNEPENPEEGGDDDMEQFVQASKQDIMDVMHMELIEQELNQKLMESARNIASCDWKWMFFNSATKLKRIEKIYKKLRKMTVSSEN